MSCCRAVWGFSRKAFFQICGNLYHFFHSVVFFDSVEKKITEKASLWYKKYFEYYFCLMVKGNFVLLLEICLFAGKEITFSGRCQLSQASTWRAAWMVSALRRRRWVWGGIKGGRMAPVAPTLHQCTYLTPGQRMEKKWQKLFSCCRRRCCWCYFFFSFLTVFFNMKV